MSAASDPIFDLVIADLRAREAQGAETYGKARMEAHDGRDSLQDAYEEALDLVAYLRKVIAERDAERAALQFAYRIIGEDTNSTAKLTERLRLAEAVCEAGRVLSNCVSNDHDSRCRAQSNASFTTSYRQWVHPTLRAPESDEDYARRMGWGADPLVGWRFGARPYPCIAQDSDGNWGVLLAGDTPPNERYTVHPTLRAAVDAYAAQDDKSLAQALAEVGEDSAD